MAIFILSATTVITFSIGALALREIVASRQLIKSEPAIVSAEAGAETALYFQLRKIYSAEVTTSCPTLKTLTLPSGATVQVCSNYFDNPYIFTSTSEEVETVLLYDPTDLSSVAAGYTSLYVVANSGSAGVTQMLVDVRDTSNPSVAASLWPVAVPGSVTVSGLDAGKSYAVFLYPCGSPAGSPPTCSSGNTVSGSVTGNGGTKGIPSKNPSLESTGVFGDMLRKLRVQLSP